ncbi:MAG: biotin carboxylase N-terminal domain-containing protein [Planctomycetota bacterium]|nr:biotin carboxylase N-terminal domain-containing protein [Planctomycetota bacterium]
MTVLPAPRYQTVLVANRGEIAARVIHTCRLLGITSVAVYSEADANARHVREADIAVPIGPAEAAQSYLNVEAIIAAAKATGAEAIHPGYGFLSENAAFARACEDAGIDFVGPSAAVLEGSGDKLVVKRRVAAAGVPVIPGPLDAVSEDPDALKQAAAETGYPLLLKASAGGGGKGMRRVAAEHELLTAAEGARREAGGAFGNTELYLERMVETARHVEVQVIADGEGDVVVLGERDCSMQRRHQKVIEECPAPDLPEDVRARLHQAGANAARALDYKNAGTVEFLLEPDGSFWFLEVNRRLQVEHPVTELCFGIDLVAWQLRVASGHGLDGLRTQALEGPRGCALEARVYAEDPANGFIPSPGKILFAREPAGPGIRVDSALLETGEVSPFYDPMLAKVIVHAETRAEAIRRLERALAEMVVVGIRTNISFLRRLVVHDAFRNVDLRVDWLDDAAAELAAADPADAELAVLALAAQELLPGGRGAQRSARSGAVAAQVPSPWDTLTGFRHGGGA